MKRFLRAAAALAILAAGTAAAQNFPAKPIRVVVPWPPGAIDNYVRFMQPSMNEDLGQPIIIENRAGASGHIGTENVARSPADGHTMLANAAGSMVTAWLISPNPPFDTLKDFAPVTMIYDSAQVLVARAGLPLNSLKEVIDYAKQNPGKLSYGSTGIGAAQHVDGETFKRVAQVDILHVPYAGFAPLIQALLGQQVDLAMTALPVAKALIAAKKLKPISSHNGRLPTDMPQVPVLEDQFPGFESAPGFVGLWVASATPRAIVQRLNAASVKALKSPDVRGKIEETGATLGANTTEEFGAIVRTKMESSARMIKAARSAGVKFE